MNEEIVKWINGDLSFLFTKNEKKPMKKQLEKEWGLGLTQKMMPRANPSEKWTGPFGQAIIQELLPHGHKPKVIKGQPTPDWETDNYVYEVKSQAFSGGDIGTAYEKVSILKHRNIPELYGKPLIIICFGHLEYILKQKSFRPDDRLDEYLELAKKWNIEFVWGSDFIKEFTKW